MAILSSLPGISVTVHNDQGQFPEYADPESVMIANPGLPSSVVTSTYIEVPPDGGRFWLKFHVEEPYQHDPYHVIFTFSPSDILDPIDTGCGPWDLVSHGWWEYEVVGYYQEEDGVTLGRDFQFTKLNLLPGDGEGMGLSEAERIEMESIGTLEIRVLLGKRKKPQASELPRKLNQSTCE